MTLPQLQPSDFFGNGVSVVNDAFAQLLTIAQTIRGTDIDSGICAPVIMTMGSDNQHWIIPVGVIGNIWVLDHGMVLPEDQYSIVSGEVVLVYTPATPYNLTIAWSSSKNGMVPPVTLTQHPTLGDRYWVLPPEAGPNALAFDHGRVLRRDQYAIQGNLVVLNYTPTNPYAIAAAWGSSGPGLVTPRTIPLVDQNPMPLDLVHYQLPPDFGRSVLLSDHGFFLDQSDYTYDNVTGIATVNYVPVEPVDIAATWGLILEGVYLASVPLSPAPDGSITVFTLGNAPVTDTIQLSALLTSGATTYYVNHVDYEIVGKRVTFLTGAPPSGAILSASMMSVIVDHLGTGGDSLGSGDSSVVIEQGETLNISPLNTTWSNNGDGLLAQITVTNGATTIKTYGWTYNTDGSVATTTETAAGHTVTITYTYDVNGRVAGTTKTVT